MTETTCNSWPEAVGRAAAHTDSETVTVVKAVILATEDRIIGLLEALSSSNERRRDLELSLRNLQDIYEREVAIPREYGLPRRASAQEMELQPGMTLTIRVKEEKR